MATTTLNFVISARASLEEVEETLRLAMMAAEGLFGAARVHLDVTYTVHTDRRCIDLKAANDAGLAVVRIFTGLLLREFGDDAFTCSMREPSVTSEPSEN
jgi:hypothetical protein